MQVYTVASGKTAVFAAGKPFRPFDDGDQHVLDALVLELAHDAQPEFGPLVLPERGLQCALLGPGADIRASQLSRERNARSMQFGAQSGSLRSACPTAVRFTCSNRLERIERGPSRGARFRDRCWHVPEEWASIVKGRRD